MMGEQTDGRAVAQQVTDVLQDRFGGAFRDLSPDASLAAQGLDSVDVLDALAALEQHFGIALDTEDLVGIECLRDLENLVNAKLSGQASNQGEGT